MPGGGTYRGVAGVTQGFAEWLGTWENYTIQVQELGDLGN
jgi:hypothetical protein